MATITTNRNSSHDHSEQGISGKPRKIMVDLGREATLVREPEQVIKAIDDNLEGIGQIAAKAVADYVTSHTQEEIDEHFQTEKLPGADGTIEEHLFFVLDAAEVQVDDAA